jgi:hypothetical protein
MDADATCQDDEDMCVVTWESSSGSSSDNLEVREAQLQALDYRAWMAFRCAQQGPTFPLEGDETLPQVQSANRLLYRKDRASLTSLASREELPVKNFKGDLLSAIESGHCILNGDVSGGLLYFNENMPAYLSSDNARVKVVRYCRYPGMKIKAMAENRDEWDADDWNAYEKECVRLVAMGREDDGDEGSDEDPGKPDEPGDTMEAPLASEVKTSVVKMNARADALHLY